VIAGLEVADFCGFPRGANIFGRTRRLDGGDRLIVSLDDYVVILDLPQHPGDAVHAVGLVVSASPGCLAGLLAALWVPAAGIRTTLPAGIPPAGVADTGNDDLTKSRNTGQD